MYLKKIYVHKELHKINRKKIEKWNREESDMSKDAQSYYRNFLYYIRRTDSCFTKQLEWWLGRDSVISPEFSEAFFHWLDTEKMILWRARDLSLMAFHENVSLLRSFFMFLTENKEIIDDIGEVPFFFEPLSVITDNEKGKGYLQNYIKLAKAYKTQEKSSEDSLPDKVDDWDEFMKTYQVQVTTSPWGNIVRIKAGKDGKIYEGKVKRGKNKIEWKRVD